MDEIRFLHVLSGTLVGIIGIIQIVLRKGGRLHRILGQAYFWAWVIVMITGAQIGSLLITFFGALGLYMAVLGYRFGVRKRNEAGWLEKAVISIALLIALITLGWGVSLLIRNIITFGIIACFFGSIFFITTFQDFREFVLGRKIRRLSGHRLQWQFEHFGRMYISYIAAMTAFTVIQNIFGITLLNWILPTFIGTLLIIFTNRYYFRKYNIVVAKKSEVETQSN